MGGILGTVLGPQGLGLTGSEQEQSVDPTTQALNDFRLKQISSLNQTGDYGALLRNIFAGSFVDSPTFQNSINASNFSQQPGLNSSDWLSGAKSDLSNSYNQTLQSLNPSFYLNNAKDYYNRITQPETSNTYSLLGLGRSGAVGEANAKAGAQLSLPISQQYLSNIFGLNQQYGQNLFSLNQEYPNADINLRNAQLQRLGQGISFSDYPRQQNQIGREQQLQGYNALLSGVPYTPETSTSGNQGLLTSLGGGAGTIAGAAILRGAS